MFFTFDPLSSHASLGDYLSRTSLHLTHYFVQTSTTTHETEPLVIPLEIALHRGPHIAHLQPLNQDPQSQAAHLLHSPDLRVNLGPGDQAYRREFEGSTSGYRGCAGVERAAEIVPSG
jgi:hypothetical protein